MSGSFFPHSTRNSKLIHLVLVYLGICKCHILSQTSLEVGWLFDTILVKEKEEATGASYFPSLLPFRKWMKRWNCGTRGKRSMSATVYPHLGFLSMRKTNLDLFKLMGDYFVNYRVFPLYLNDM